MLDRNALRAVIHRPYFKMVFFKCRHKNTSYMRQVSTMHFSGPAEKNAGRFLSDMWLVV